MKTGVRVAFSRTGVRVIPLQRGDDGYGMFEYARHEGNLAMLNILSGHGADERATAGHER